MNLIQIQERLKELPLQAVMAYANGMNPEVPPYVALSELERRKRMDQMAQPAQMPQGTVKDKIEQQVGLAEQQKQQQQAAMQQMMTAAAQPRGLPAAPVPAQMFSRGGGIVAFSTGNDVEGVDPGSEGGSDEEQSGELDVEKEIANLLRRGKSRLGEQPAALPSPLAQRAELIKKYPQLAILDKPIGQEAMTGLQALQAKQAEEDERQRAALKDQRKMQFYKALIDAGEATRGQKGLGGLFGGFGRSMLGAEEQLGKQETEIRGRGLKREADMLTLKNKIQDLQRSRAEGDVEGEIKHAREVAELANKLGISQNALLRGMISGLASLRGREVAAEATVEAAGKRAAGAGGAGKVTDFQRKVQTLAADYVRQGMSQEEAETKATREVMAAAARSADVRASTEDLKAAEDAATRAARPYMSNPTEYARRYREAYNEALQRRTEGRGTQPPPPAGGGNRPINLDDVAPKR